MNNLYFFIERNKNLLSNKLALSIISLDGETKIEASFSKFVSDVDKYAQYLGRKVSRNQRVIVALPVCYELYVTVFAIFKLGACSVLLNPTMNRKSLKYSLNSLSADVIVSKKSIFKYRIFFWEILKIKNKISLDSAGIGVTHLFLNIQESGSYSQVPQIDNGLDKKQQDINTEQAALISFTSGSSGVPKAVLRTYGNLVSQHLALKKIPRINDHYDITAFPVAVLHHLCNGISCEVANINYKNVSGIENQTITKQVINKRVNSLSGAISYLIALGEWLKRNNQSTKHIKIIATGGSPISSWQIKRIKACFPCSRILILYGSSEAEPIAHIEVDDSFVQKDGYLVGGISDDVSIAFSDSAKKIADINDFYRTSGEIYVSGNHVCGKYFKNKMADKKYKFMDTNNVVWHRTGDIGFINNNNQLVLTGRVENQIKKTSKTNEVMGSYPIEVYIENMLGVKKCAVVESREGLNIIYLNKNEARHNIFFEKLKSDILAMYSVVIHQIKKIDGLPLDARHQGKIQYEKLKSR